MIKKMRVTWKRRARVVELVKLKFKKKKEQSEKKEMIETIEKEASEREKRVIKKKGGWNYKKRMRCINKASLKKR